MVTVTSTVPALSAGLVTVIELAVSTVTVPEVDPNLTEVAPDRFDPAIVTVVPPATGPLDGLIEVTTGAGAGVV